MNKDSIRQIGVMTATLGMIMINTIGDLIPFNGITSWQVLNLYKIYFSPVSYTFAIWALIIGGLIAFSIFQALPSQKNNPYLRKIGWLYVASCVMGAGWVLFWHFQKTAFTTAGVLGLTILLILIYIRLNIGKEQVSRGMRYFVHLPFSIYLGWITITMFGSISVFLHSIGWDGFGLDQRIWAVVLIVLGVVMAELIAFNRQDLVFLAVFIWFFIGIAEEQYGVSPVFEAACAAIILIVIIAIITLVVKPRLKKIT